MRETNFIKQNKEKWAEFETILKEPRKNPDKLSELFIQLSDDLSYSRTFYPNRSVKLYLNNLTQQVFNSIYKNKKEGWKKFWFFWKEELPLLVYSCRREFLISFVVFIISVGIGVISSAYDPDFPQQILGQEYVKMTIENINSGDPMKVYKVGHQTDMFLGITFNNLFVSFRTFLFGIVASIGTIGMMMYNGIMVGTFQYFFYQMESAHPGVLKQSLLTIWMHGTLEISSIIIAGAAGLVLGKGMLFPGTYTRLQAFQVSARKGLKLMIGISPIIIFAAFIESFVTRYTDVPDILRIAVIGISLTFIIGYFIVYPIIKHRTSKSLQQFEYRLPPTASNHLNFKTIKNSGEIFADIFIFYRKNFKKLFLIAFGLSIIVTIVLNVAFPEILKDHVSYGLLSLVNVFNLFSYDSFKQIIVINSLLFTVISYAVFRQIMKEAENEGGYVISTEKNRLNRAVDFIKTFIPFLLSNFILVLLPGWLGALAFLILFPFLTLWSFVMQAEGKNVISGFGQMTSLLTHSGFGRVMAIHIMSVLLSFIFFFLIDSPLLWMYVEFLSWNLPFSAATIATIWMALLSFMLVLALNLVLPILISGIGFLYFSLLEIKQANHLTELIETFGTKKKRLLYGNES